MMDTKLCPWLLLIVLILCHDKLFAEFVYPTPDTYESDMLCFAKFKLIQFHALRSARLQTHSVTDTFDCTYLCVKNKKCVSFNIQATPNQRHLFHCELLDDNKFNSPEKFQGNETFHHFAVKTLCMTENPCKHGGTCLPNYESNGYRCKCIQPYTGNTCEIPPPNCMEYNKAGHNTSGVYNIDPDGLGAFDVFCDQTTAGGGWTVFQKRLDGSVDFYRGWADYKQGFGNLRGEFWLGLDKIHRLTSQTSNKLRVELEDFNGTTAYAEFDMFVVSSEAAKYQLSQVGKYSGTAGNSFSAWCRGMAFTTKDQDNDIRYGNCAVLYKGGWWYRKCHGSNLNGLYHHGQHSSYADGINWMHWKGYYYSAKRAEMKIRPANFTKDLCLPQNPCQNGGTCVSLYETNRGFECRCAQPFMGDNCEIPPQNCSEYHKAGHNTSGVYTIDPDGLGPFDVFCDQTTAGGGWTVFQKRLDGSVDFYRGWADYKQGFGNLSDEFWLGLDKIHRLTSQTSNKLRVELEDFNGTTAYAEFDMFAVSSEAAKYNLGLGSYSGTAGDSLTWHIGMNFTTKDQDNDNNNNGNCAVFYKGAWWYRNCHASNLNGLYHHGHHASYADGVNWSAWKGHHYSAKRAEMKMKP